MIMSDPTHPETSQTADQQQGIPRKNRGIRFSDPEWDEVKQAAQAHGVTPAEFVRERILDLIRSPDAPSHAAIPSHLVPLIEHTFRYSYMLATKMRDAMLTDQQDEQLEELIKEARALQDSLSSAASQ